MLSKLREPVNGLTHLGGAIAAFFGLIALLVVGWGGAAKVVSLLVYGLSLIALFSASAAYHMAKVEPAALQTLRKFDHSAIFLLIAGTYTPVALVTIGGALGWTMFGLTWGLAAVGTVCEVVPWRYGRAVALVLYVVMGWLAIGAVSRVFEGLGTTGGVLIVVGGALYTVGIVFYAWRSLPHSHGIWHLFVLGGSACHFAAIVLFGF